jgi:tetratricopeptide (TPR) repeat protein
MVLNGLGYLYLASLGEYEKALEYFGRSAAASTRYPNPLDGLGETYFFLGKLDSAILQYEEAKRVEPSWTITADSKLSCIDALKEDYGSAFRRLESLQAQRGWAPMAGTWGSFLHSWLGERVRARRELDMMLRTLKKTDPEVGGSDYWFLGALAFSLDQPKAAQWCFSEYARLGRAATPKDSTTYAARLASANALIDLKLGHLQSAQSELAAVRSSLPSLGGGSRRILEPLVHNAEAELLLANGHVDSAIAHWLKQPPLTYWHFMYVWPERLAATNILFPRDGLARAYAMKGDIEAAIREYERITRFDPSSRDRRFIHPLHRYELAKLYEKKGLKEQAIAEYERFLTLWKNADRDRPEPRDAKKQLAKLAGKNPRREM